MLRHQTLTNQYYMKFGWPDIFLKPIKLCVTSCIRTLSTVIPPSAIEGT